MIEFIPGRYFARMFFQSIAGEFDIMGALYREPDGSWMLPYRFRYYRDDRAFGSADEKHWYRGQVRDDIDPLDSFRAFIGGLEAIARAVGFADCPVDIVVLDSDDPATIIQVLHTRSWFHVNRDPPSQPGGDA